MSDERHAAVEDDDLSDHIAIAEHHNDGLRHFLGLSHAAERDIARKIGRELRNLYVIGYTPTNGVRDGKWRKITVDLNPPRGLPPLQLFNKSGYYAPQE